MLANFILECIIFEEEPVETDLKKGEHERLWTMYVDRSSSLVRSRVGLILTSLEGDIAKYTLHFKFLTTNNEAKYETLTTRLKMVKELRVPRMKVCGDLQLIVR